MFEVTLSENALGDLQFFRKNERSAIIDAIEEQLVTEPLTETRNRKPLKPNDLAAWEIRVGTHRVFYDVDIAGSKVIVKAIGRKEHNKLFIRGKEFQL